MTNNSKARALRIKSNQHKGGKWSMVLKKGSKKSANRFARRFADRDMAKQVKNLAY